MPFYYDGELIGGPRGPAGPDGNPIGTIISFMGATAPKDYLVCDGAAYNVADYPKLAAFFAAQFGEANHFGGDGSATFAVPDMRNLFLRGYHGDAEEQLSGEIGEKQNGTENPAFSLGTNPNGQTYLWGNYNKLASKREDVVDIPNADKQSALPGDRSWCFSSPENISTNDVMTSTYTSRPVNMAVLYCIKAVESVPSENQTTGSVPSGAVILWSGTEENIPSGWALCDGQNGTPDLRGKFVLGAGPDHAVGDTGGTEEVALTEEQVPLLILGFSTDLAKSDYSGAEFLNEIHPQYSEDAAPHPNMPPYYVLAYIMKL